MTTTRAVRPDRVSPPERTCIGCRRRRSVDALVRLTLGGDEDEPTVVVGGPSAGRGAWVCCGQDTVVDHECLRTALARKAFGRAWRTVVGDDVVARIQRLSESSVS
jgi:predicted RNA-binding protein YlxR (DUF448 family)